LTAFALLSQYYHVLFVKSNPTSTDCRIVETLLKRKAKTYSLFRICLHFVVQKPSGGLHENTQLTVP
jgi:hypothetical protein